MTDASAGPDEPKLSPDLRRAIAADTIGCFVDNAVLKKPDVAVLKKILARDADVVGGVAISRKRAIGALARSDQSEETARLLARALADRGRPPQERAAAAANLGLLAPAVAERPLLMALAEVTGPLRVEVIKALGQVGGAEALAALGKIEPPEDDPARRQLALSRLAIAFREKLDGASADALERELGLRWSDARAEPLDPKAARAIHGAIGGSTFGVALDPEIGLAFDCGATRNVLFLNKELKPGGYVQAVTRRPMIAGLIVAQAEELQYFTVRWLLFTAPTKDGVRMVLVRPNGEPAFEGLAAGEAKALHFSLRDVGVERTAAAIEGEIGEDSVAWTMRVWRGPIRGKLRPRPIAGAARVGPRAREPAAGGEG